MRIVLVNPNTSTETTAEMVALAEATAGARGGALEVVGLTAATGAGLIRTPEQLREAGDAVLDLTPAILAAAPHAVVVAAFGDPGRDALAARLDVPVVGLGEASIAEAARDPRGFAIVTTTPELDAALAALVDAHGAHDAFHGVEYTADAGDGPTAPVDLPDMIGAACSRAVRRWPLGTIVIGGGPLARHAARARDEETVRAGGVRIVDPVTAAVELAAARGAA